MTRTVTVDQRPVGHAVSAVLARYDELAHLVAESVEPDHDRWRPATPHELHAATRAVHGEARQLDARRFDAWLEWLTEDAVLWIPLAETPHPATDQSLFLDDRRRLGDRVRWRGERSAWGQHPPSATVRTVGTIEAWTGRPVDVRRVLVRSAFVIVEQRLGGSRSSPATRSTSSSATSCADAARSSSSPSCRSGCATRASCCDRAPASSISTSTG